MKELGKLGEFYLGKLIDKETGNLQDEPLLYPSKDLTTHAVCLGMTGSGKTGLGIVLLEEACIDNLPALVIDPKGDLSDLLLTFPDLSAEEFAPWIDPAEAAGKGVDPNTYAASVAKKWKEKLAEWGQSAERIRSLKNAVEMAIYTPASTSGIPLSILSSFAAPPQDQRDPSTLRERIISTTSSLLSLIGIEADPVKSREHILISTLIGQSWEKGINVDLPMLIQQIQKPPFDKIGVLDLNTFFPAKERIALSVSLNNLLASPGFQAWMEGEPLDIKQMLYTKEGKPKLSILSIAHLSDNERMFFVTLFLNELLAWMRRQPGTSSLRAILYMDEIFGYFPPVANPPSKLPLITLLKQARAFGLGIVLATQNPVDLDYKGLSNCGTWFIGKLQTDRDKSKVFEGIKSSSNTDINTDIFNKMMSMTGNQNFILLNVHEKEPALFKTRWALSYLRGPLTLTQIQTLTKQLLPSRSVSTPSVTISTTEKQSSTTTKPIVPPNITEFFANRALPRQQVQYQPMLAGLAKLHFVDPKNQIDTWQNVFFIAPPGDDGSSVLWEQGENHPEVKNVLEKTPWQECAFKEIPSGLLQDKNFNSFEKSFAAYLYEHQYLTIYRASDLKLSSTLDESEGDFRTRVALGMREKRDDIVNKLREKYKAKVAALNVKMQQAQEKVEKQKQQAGLKKAETFISMGATLLGSLFGKGITKGTISQAGTSMKQLGKMQKGSQDVERAEESYKNYQQQLQDIENELNLEISQTLASMDAAGLKIDKATVRLRKGDISVEKVALLWWPITKGKG